MDLRQLNALLAVADRGSFSAAARALHTVQSNVSTHVARLEKELGATLIDRATGTLTAEGEVVAARARRVQGELEALTADVASLHSEVAGSVRVGVIGTTARWLVPRLMQAMPERHPRVHVVIVDATTTSLIPQLEAGRLDLAIVNLPVNDPDLVVELLFEEDHVLVVPDGDELAGRDSVSLPDLADRPLLIEPQGTGFRDQLDEQAAAAGIELRPHVEVDGMRLLASLAFQGFGAAILPASAIAAGQPGPWHRVAVKGLDRRAVGVARRRKGLLSAPARALLDVVSDVVREGDLEPGIHPSAER
jgi:LysR family hydrogen peroxide-inducible transcriptional activator